MTPAESVAYSLIQQHCAEMADSLGTPHYTMFPLLPGTLQLNSDRDHGARVRLAFDLLNACCACEELFPVTNPRFWQRVARELWSDGCEVSGLNESEFDFPPFTEHSFANFDLLCYGPAANRLKFWTSFFYGDTSSVVLQCQVAWRLAMAALRPYMNLTLRKLIITTSIRCPSTRYSSKRDGGLVAWPEDPHDRAAFHTLVQLASDPHSRIDFRLNVSHTVNSPIPMRLSDASDIAVAVNARPHVAVEGLSLSVADHRSTANAVREQIVASGALLRVAFVHGSTKTLQVECGWNADHRLVGALLSIVPESSTLESLYYHPALYHEPDRLLHLAWVVYGTHHPRRSQCLSLNWNIQPQTNCLNHSEMAYVEELVRCRVPLRDVVFAVLEKRYTDGPSVHVDCFVLGSIVTVAGGTLLYCEPGIQSIESAVAWLTQDEQLDVIARVEADGSVGVVYPGYGLVWVNEASVAWVTTVDDDEQEKKFQSVELGEQAALSSLSIQYKVGRDEAPAGTLDLLRLYLGSSLQSLDLTGVQIPRESLQKILETSPLLQSLALHTCVMETVSPLVDVNSFSRGCHLSSLSFFKVTFAPAQPVESLAPVFLALAQPSHPLSVALRELHVDLFRLPQDVELVDLGLFVRALEQPRVRLRRVTADLSYRVAYLEPRAAALYASLVRLKGRVLSDPPPSTIVATLSVLRVKAAGVCNEAIARNVLWFVGGSVEQSLGWTLH